MSDEKQKSDDSDDQGNYLPDVGIQAPYLTQNGQQPSACDHKKGCLKTELPEKTEKEQKETGGVCDADVAPQRRLFELGRMRKDQRERADRRRGRYPGAPRRYEHDRQRRRAG